jgi:site-specific DNA recombinase
MAKRITDPKRAVAYLRVSTEDQNLGPEAQRAAIERWAAANGVAVVAWHQDHGVSGGAPVDARPGLLAAIADVGKLSAGLLVVAKRDRLARDVLIAAMIEQLAARQGARVASAAGEGTENDDPSGQLMRTMVDAFSQYERALIQARTKAALGVKRARGEVAGTVPYGFERTAGGKLVQNEAEQRVLSVARELRANGVSFRGVVAALERTGLTSRSGLPFGLTQVARMLKAA